MATRFNEYPALPYIGSPQGAATVLCTPAKAAPMTVPLLLDWLVYWTLAQEPATMGVNVDLSMISPAGGTLDSIRSVKVDNTFSSSPIYVVFPDTSDVVTCAPQTVVTMPVNTNAQNFTVYAENLREGFLPLTRVYLYNIQLPPSVDPAVQLTYPQWLGSPSIQRTSQSILTPGFGPPALGDQIAWVTETLTTVGQTTEIIPAQASGFFTFTHLNVNVFNTSGSSGLDEKNCVIRRAVSLDNIFYMRFDLPVHGSANIISLNGMNIKISADEKIEFAFISTTNSGTNSAAKIVAHLCYTYNPDE